MCVKCIIDSGHNGAVARWLSDEMKVFDRTIDALFKDKSIQLTPEQHQTLIDVSQEWCDLAEVITDKIESWGYKLRPIAIAHSYPNKK